MVVAAAAVISSVASASPIYADKVIRFSPGKLQPYAVSNDVNAALGAPDQTCIHQIEAGCSFARLGIGGEIVLRLSEPVSPDHTPDYDLWV